MSRYAILTALLFIGCAEMSREEVIRATRQCEEAKMKPQIVGSIWTYEIYRVNCIPKEATP